MLLPLWSSSLLERIAILLRVSFDLRLRFPVWRVLPAAMCSAKGKQSCFFFFFLKWSMDHNTSLSTEEQREKSREMKGPSYPSGAYLGKRGLIHKEKFLKGLKENPRLDGTSEDQPSRRND